MTAQEVEGTEKPGQSSAVAPDFLSTLPWESILMLVPKQIQRQQKCSTSVFHGIPEGQGWFLELERDRVTPSATPCTWNS